MRRVPPASRARNAPVVQRWQLAPNGGMQYGIPQIGLTLSASNTGKRAIEISVRVLPNLRRVKAATFFTRTLVGALRKEVAG